MIVSNSTPLIYLSKIDKLYLLKELFRKVLIPVSVKEEVVDAGRKFNHIDSIEVGKAIEEKWVVVEKVRVISELEGTGIDRGEKEAISLGKIKELMVLLDQTHARAAARVFGVEHRGTIYVLFLALKEALIDLDTYILSLEDLADVGFRMSQNVYLQAIRMGKEIGRK